MIVGALCGYFDVSEKGLCIAIIICVGMAYVVGVVVNVVYVSKLAKKVDSLLPILYDEGNPDRYLTELELLLGDVKSPALRSVYCINRATALFDKEEYVKAKDALLEMDPKKILGVNRLIYHLNMALICMHLGEEEETLQIWHENDKEFLKLKDSDNAGAAVASLAIFTLIKGSRFEAASNELETAKTKWKRERDQKEFRFLEDKMTTLQDMTGTD